mmetsp:Transcript_1647/g.3842  ORF Transcript_1647/g.3842 Transcript_1647/m.3842 type:complete len:263 (-) Transcript_1647:46-834(-)
MPKAPVNRTSYRSNANSNTSRPLSENKPYYQKVGNNSLKKIKFHSKSCDDAAKQERVFLKLDSKNPRHAHKIQQRRKAIQKGKNTVGYDIYCKSIPKEKRQKRSMITPSTPDHTLDIPNKKWNGMVRSWRVALHRYDPVDLQQSFAAAQQAAVAERENSSKSHTDSEMLTVKEKEIANSGLVNLVHVTPTNGNTSDQVHQTSSAPRTPSGNGEFNYPAIATPEDELASNNGGIISELNQWEATRQEGEYFSGEDDDSDDDLL